MSNDTLSCLWSTPGFKPKYFLFLTHSFAFNWFHNVVLSNLEKSLDLSLLGNEKRDFRIDVIASECDPSDRGEMYHLRHWAKMRGEFQIFPLPMNKGLQHSKGIIASDGGSRVLSGFGSSNLSTGGWQDNLEVWKWDKGESAETLLSILSKYHQAGESPIPEKLIDSWKALIGKRKKDSNLFVLSGKGVSPVQEKIKNWVTKNKPILEVNIVSPFFSNKCPKWFSDCKFDSNTKYKIVVDGSNNYTVGLHRKNVNQLLKSLSAKSSHKTELLSPVVGDMHKPLHAKLVEIKSKNENTLRIYGSANFTEAAWDERTQGNTELVYLEYLNHKDNDFINILSSQGITLKPPNFKNDKRNSDIIDKHFSESTSRVLWGLLIEPTEDVAAQIHLQLAGNFTSKGLKSKIIAKFEDGLSSSDVKETKNISKALEDPKNWDWVYDQTKNRYDAKWIGKQEFVVSELIEVHVYYQKQLLTEVKLWVRPNFERRDKKSGTPYSLEKYTLKDAIAGRAKPVIPPRKTIVPPTEKDDEEHQEEKTKEEISFEIEDDDYNFEPSVELMRKKILELSNANMPILWKELEERLKVVIRLNASPDKEIAKAALSYMQSRSK